MGMHSTLLPQAQESSPYFDTTFLANFSAVNAAMLKDGFKDVTFASDDGLALQGLLLERENATHSIIVCCGFYPGRKEGMASLFAMLPADCNLLFFDARGHGKSEGRFLTNIHNYGKEEFRDVLGAIAFMRQCSPAPIIMYGICAGSFHATRALLYLQKYNALASYNIKGLIFDSGFGSIMESTAIPKKHLEHKIMPGLFSSYLYRNQNKKEVKEKLPYRITWALMGPCVTGIEWCVAKMLERNKNETNLMPAISQLACPILFIHAQNDTYTPFSDIATLASQTPHATCWWIEDSEHAANHLKHKQEYSLRLCTFINRALTR